jgi:hypothetical protein
MTITLKRLAVLCVTSKSGTAVEDEMGRIF